MTLTVEQRIERDFEQSVESLLAGFAKEGKTSKQVAEFLDCGVSNVRRIARKYNVRFNQPTPQPTIIQSEAFLERNINSTNFLCRSWNDLVSTKHNKVEDIETV